MKKVLFGLMIFIFAFTSVGYGQTQQSDQLKSPEFVKSEIGFSIIFDLSFEEMLSKVKAELKKEGFGILTEVDVKATLKEKLDEEVRPYHILGACNPTLAHQALQAEPQIGLMLPCKFIVYVDEDDKTVVSAVDPVKMMENIENEKLAEVAKTVQKKFINVLASL
jgi:uncharacterized protein (DUF302 family)